MSSPGESHPEALAETFTRLDSTLVLPDGQSKPYFRRRFCSSCFSLRQPLSSRRQENVDEACGPTALDVQRVRVQTLGSANSHPTPARMKSTLVGDNRFGLCLFHADGPRHRVA